MRRISAIFGACFLAIACFSTALAQTGGTAIEPLSRDPLIPIISGPNEIGVNRTIVLSASDSSGLGEETSFEWYIDSVLQPSEGDEIIYTPLERGLKTIRLIVRTVKDGQAFEGSTSRSIIAYNRKITLIADETVPDEKLDVHEEVAFNEGVYLRIVRSEEESIPLVAEEHFKQLISKNISALADAEAIVIWSDDIAGLHALMKVLENNEERLKALKNQTIILITNRSLGTLARTARGPFALLQPKQILVTRKEAMNPLVSARSVDGFLEEIAKRDIDVVVVDSSTSAIRPWNLLTSLINYMITQGISTQVVILLLILPVIATLLAFFKQVIGITTYGLYTPSIIALSFLALGWKVGLVFLLFILVTGYFTRKMMRGWRILYIPKVAILLTVVSLTLLILLALASANNIIFGRDTIFILLIMSTLAETLLSAKQEEGWYQAILGMSETIGAALVCVVIVQWSTLQSIILAYPETILLTLVANLLIGRFTGLRLMEFFRFRDIIQAQQE